MEVKSSGCPLGHKCEEVKTDSDGEQYIARCEWYVHIRGKDPQTEKEVDKFGCAIAWMPVLQIENAQMSRQAGAAIESFRNQMMRDNHAALKLQANSENKEITKCA